MPRIRLKPFSSYLLFQVNMDLEEDQLAQRLRMEQCPLLLHSHGKQLQEQTHAASLPRVDGGSSSSSCYHSSHRSIAVQELERRRGRRQFGRASDGTAAAAAPHTTVEGGCGMQCSCRCDLKCESSLDIHTETTNSTTSSCSGSSCHRGGAAAAFLSSSSKWCSSPQRNGVFFLLLVLMFGPWSVTPPFGVNAKITEDLVVETTKGKIRGVTLKSATNK